MKKNIHLTVFFLLTSFITAQAQDLPPAMNAKDIKMLIDSISFSLKKYYIYPDKAALIEKALKENYKKGAYKDLKNKIEVANTLNNDIQKVHHDGHMRLMHAPDYEKMLLTVLPDSLQKKETEKELAEERTQNFYFVKTEIMAGNIGYLRWDGFVGFTKEAKPTYESAFQFVANTQALIIDMRYNGGGSPETVNAMLNYFFEKRLPMNHIIDHKHDTVKNYTDPKVTAFKLNMPVYVITSKNTFSGAEDFTYAMKVAKRATIVGDTTGGGAHPTGPGTLGQGFVLNIPNARSYHELTGTNWEGTGVYPDVYIRGQQALEKAQLLIFKDRLAKAKDDQEKHLAQWFLTVVENKIALAQSGGLNYTAAELQKYCGEFKPIPGPGSSPYITTIVLKGGSVYRSIPVPPDWKLIPISKTRFLYDNDDMNRYIEFTFDKDGNVSGMSINRNDASFFYNKIKQ